MKKTRAILLTIILITITFASCNLDGSAGIFKQISQSKEPLSIRYIQLLGADSNPLSSAAKLYFRTTKGIQEVTNPRTTKTIVASKYEHIIQGAAYKEDKIFYITNNEDESDANTVNEYDLLSDTDNPRTVSSIINPTNLRINSLSANGMIMVEEKDGTGKKFELLKYDASFNFTVQVASFDFTASSSKYSIHKIIQQTAQEQRDNVPMIVSFVEGTDKYIHYLVDPSNQTSQHITEFDNVKIANFMYDFGNDKTYILTTDGILYHAGTLSAPNTKVKMTQSNKAFGENAFAYVVGDGTLYHMIAKPSNKTSPLQVYSFIYDATTTATVKEVKSGYAKDLSLVTIVSSQMKDSTASAVSSELLVATHENGMFDIEIIHADANKDIPTNGSASAAEEYTF